MGNYKQKNANYSTMCRPEPEQFSQCSDQVMGRANEEPGLFNVYGSLHRNNIHHHHHHHISVTELGHLLTRSGLTYPEVSSKVCHDSFCQLGNSVSLPWVIIF